MTDERPATDAVTCRLLRPDDSALIERADDDVFDTRPRADFIRDFFDDPRALLAGAIDTALDDGGRLVGMASAHWYNHPDKPRQLFIDEVGVAGSHRRRGIGAALLALLLARGRKLGCVEAWVGTEAANGEARALYAAAGGVADGGDTVIYSFDLSAPAPRPPMNVLIPTPLRSYTQGASRVQAEGATLDALLHDLDRRYPGIRFRMIDEQGRMRAHVRFFVRDTAVHDLALPLAADDEVMIVQALSGG